MQPENAAAARQLDTNRETLARQLAERHFAKYPELRERYGEIGFTKCLEDAHYHLRYLSEAVRAEEPRLFAEYVNWAKVMLTARNVPESDLLRNLELLRDLLREQGDELLSARAAGIIDYAITQLGSVATPSPFVSKEAPHGELATSYLQALLRGDRYAANQLIRNAYKSGAASIKDIYLNVFQQVQYEIGRLWQNNAISVADEHFCTAATQAIMSQFYPDLFALPKNGKTLVMASIGGELHEIGARMVADFFELEGWTTYYYGANTPTQSLISAICDKKPDVVGVSVTMTFHVPVLRDFITAMRSNQGCSDARVIVGGYPFKISADLWSRIGADGFAPDAATAIELASKLAGVE